MSPYYVSKQFFHRLVPAAVRHRLYLGMPAPIRKLRRRFIHALESTARHDEIYDPKYFATDVDPTMGVSADTMAGSLVHELRPEFVLDIGCGSGLLLLSLARLGVRGRGFDYASAAIELCRQRGLDVQRLNIEVDPIPSDRGDVAISTEVAEHLPASCADRFVKLLCTVARRHVVLTAAVPGSPGTNHVNEQPNEYWIDKIASHGFVFDKDRSTRWRQEWQYRGVANCFVASVMVFDRS
jgi:SAM-dependent methyltransferase